MSRRPHHRPKTRARAGWGADWSAAKGGARDWASGWWRDEACPPSLRRRRAGAGPDGRALDAAPGGSWREVGACGGARWRTLHTDRAGVVEVLRRAGYIQRHRWGREEKGTKKHGKAVVTDWRYQAEAGPVAGLPAVDAWRVARKLSACSSEWRVNLRQRADTSLTAVALPAACGLGHICPVCAAGKASQRARALRTVLEHLHHEAPAKLALVTLTQQARKGESLQSAQGRLRNALDRCFKGRPGRRARALFSGWWVGLEVTFNQVNRWWHAHAHLVMRLVPGVDEVEARAALADLWTAASAAAAEETGLEGAGWDRYAGGVVDGDPTAAGGWWRPIDPTAAEEVYQACKYPTPITDLEPESMAEFLAVAHGRRWHYGAGVLQRVSALAAELDEDGGAWTLDELPRVGGDEDAQDGAPAVDLGKSASSMNPRLAPRLDDVAPGYGISGMFSREDVDTTYAALFVVPSAKIVAIANVIAQYSGKVWHDLDHDRWVVGLPRDWVGDEVVVNAEALRRRRLDTEQN